MAHLLGQGGNGRKSKAVIGAHPAGHMVLVELLSPQEVMNTKFSLSENAKLDKLEAYQAYVLEIGPNADISKLGFKVGDRIALSGGFIPLPNYDNGERKKGLIEAHTIKAVLVEDADDEA